MDGNYNLYDHKEAREKAIEQFMRDINTTNRQRINSLITVDFDNNGFVSVWLEVDGERRYENEYSFSTLYKEQEQIRGMHAYLDEMIRGLNIIYQNACGANMDGMTKISSEERSSLFDARATLERVKQSSEIVKLLNRTYYTEG